MSSGFAVNAALNAASSPYICVVDADAILERDALVLQFLRRGFQRVGRGAGGVPGLAPGREDLIIAGTIILMESMDYFGFNDLVVSDFGLREGIVRDLYNRMLSEGEASHG